MPSAKRSLAASLMIAGLAVSACGSSASTPIPASGRHVAVPGSPTGEVVLTQLGVERIGIQTAVARKVNVAPVPVVRPASSSTAVKRTAPPAPRPAGGPTVVIPYSAIVYAPDGATYAFTSRSALVYTEVPVTVDHIDGDSAYLQKGPKPGSRVVSVGAEELFGVQTGVLEQT